jgi:hypothetical protein
MKPRQRWVLILTILFSITIAACSTRLSANNTEDQNAPPLEQPADTEAMAPTLEAAPQPDGLPNGVLVDPQTGSSLMVYNTIGQFEYALDAPGIGNYSSQKAHLAGSGSSAALVYHSWDPEQALQVNKQGSISTLRSTDAFFGMAGAKGQSALAFSEVVIDGFAPHSYLYAGNLDSIGSTGPFYDLNDETMQMALLPVAVEATAGQPQTVWYTHSAWGIGGVDLIFPINRGLYAFDLANNQAGQALDAERNYQGISPDMRFAGSTTFDTQADQSMTITEILGGRDIVFPLRSDSDRGAGYAVFSPDSQLVAWLEAAGSFAAEPSSYRSVVRIGEVNSGTVVYDIEDNSVAQALNAARITFMNPVGWLDNQTLLIETRTVDWGQVVLVRANLAEGTLAYFCDGAFVGFAYP